jgi:hypothetical protein
MAIRREGDVVAAPLQETLQAPGNAGFIIDKQNGPG